MDFRTMHTKRKKHIKIAINMCRFKHARREINNLFKYSTSLAVYYAFVFVMVNAT